MTRGFSAATKTAVPRREAPNKTGAFAFPFSLTEGCTWVPRAKNRRKRKTKTGKGAPFQPNGSEEKQDARSFRRPVFFVRDSVFLLFFARCNSSALFICPYRLPNRCRKRIACCPIRRARGERQAAEHGQRHEQRKQHTDGFSGQFFHKNASSIIRNSETGCGEANAPSRPVF